MECGISDARSVDRLRVLRTPASHDGAIPRHPAVFEKPFSLGLHIAVTPLPMSGPTLLRLTAQPQALDQRLVSFGFCSPHVLEEPPTPAHEYEQPSAGVMVLTVQLEMLGKTVDSLREERDLHVR